MESKEVTIDPKTNQPGWVVNNTNTPEQWVIEDSIFKKKYDACPEEPGLYKPKGGPMLASQVFEDLEITPPVWGGAKQKINSGSYILMDPSNPIDVYGIGEHEFQSTYKFTEQSRTI